VPRLPAFALGQTRAPRGARVGLPLAGASPHPHVGTPCAGMTQAPRSAGAGLPRAHNQTRVPCGETWRLGWPASALASGPNGNEPLL